MASVKADLDTYAGWRASYRPTGIFFDEASTSASKLAYYTSVASYARSLGFKFVSENCTDRDFIFITIS